MVVSLRRIHASKACVADPVDNSAEGYYSVRMLQGCYTKRDYSDDYKGPIKAESVA